MKGNIAGLMQQAQKMQAEMKKAQEELAHLEVEGQAGGGLVSVTMNGRHAVKRVRIDPSLQQDLEMLEDLLAAAFNDAVNKATEQSEAKMAEVTRGMPLPPGMNFGM